MLQRCYLTGLFAYTATLDEPTEAQNDVLKKDERWRHARLDVILDHQEVHAVFPDLDRVGVDLFKDIAVKCEKTSVNCIVKKNISNIA